MREKKGYPSMFSTAWLKPSFGMEAKAKLLCPIPKLYNGVIY